MPIKITLDVGDAPSVLAALADARIAQQTTNAMAESYRDDALDWIHAGQAFDTTPGKHTGVLAQSINFNPVGGGVAEVYANAAYAGFVEFGTGPHVIAPKNGRKGLKIPVAGGGFVLRRAVNHPGSKPYPYFFADMGAREANMLAAARSVLAAVMAEAA